MGHPLKKKKLYRLKALKRALNGECPGRRNASSPNFDKRKNNIIYNEPKMDLPTSYT